MNRPEKVFRERQKNYNKVKGGNYHEYYNSYYSHRSVVISVRRGRRLLLEKTTVGTVVAASLLDQRTATTGLKMSALAFPK